MAAATKRIPVETLDIKRVQRALKATEPLFVRAKDLLEDVKSSKKKAAALDRNDRWSSDVDEVFSDHLVPPEIESQFQELIESLTETVKTYESTIDDLEDLESALEGWDQVLRARWRQLFVDKFGSRIRMSKAELDQSFLDAVEAAAQLGRGEAPGWVFTGRDIDIDIQALFDEQVTLSAELAEEQDQEDEEDEAPAQLTHKAGDKEELLEVFDALSDRRAGEYVTLLSMREALPGWSRDRFDDAINELRRDWVLTLSPAEGRHEVVSRKLIDAGIPDASSSNASRILVYAMRRETDDEDEEEERGHRHTTSNEIFERSGSDELSHGAVFDAIDQSANGIGRAFIADVRDHLGGTRAEQDEILKQMQREGKIVLYSNDVPSQVTAREDEGGIQFGDPSFARKRTIVYRA